MSKVMWELFSGTIDACKVTGAQSWSQGEGNRDREKKTNLPQPNVAIQVPCFFINSLL